MRTGGRSAADCGPAAWMARCLTAHACIPGPTQTPTPPAAGIAQALKARAGDAASPPPPDESCVCSRGEECMCRRVGRADRRTAAAAREGTPSRATVSTAQRRSDRADHCLLRRHSHESRAPRARAIALMPRGTSRFASSACGGGRGRHQHTATHCGYGHVVDLIYIYYIRTHPHHRSHAAPDVCSRHGPNRMAGKCTVV